ncbi:toxin-antitoxin system HicB family antitoxin [Seleniivibrio sp.]|uniref:type II toxin-antitoxin system HicB family antitoxin n=1 Tax=Seleniivibrio sp. TaxID=2898801 RepID=UPI0025D86B27|nr:toxin-antitoxin system HicB family antitoxin [Seleniivibrio sp.]MCD8554979.1 toxin-antitoxin system HicB family antitoxin [Seleniivibrio sp.]
MKKDIKYYMNLPYTVEITPCEEGSYFVQIKELEGCFSEGDTVEEAYSMIEEAKEGWLSAALEHGFEIPLPESMEKEYSGKFVVRVPKSLHKKLIQTAKKEGVSLNLLASSLLAENLVKHEKKKETA